MNPHLSLLDAPLGHHVRIAHLRSAPEICARLRELGFCENAVVRCVTRGHHAIVCEVCNSRLGLNREIAESILVHSL